MLLTTIYNLIYLYSSGKGRLNYAVRFHYYNFIVGCSYALRNHIYTEIYGCITLNA